MNYWDSLLFLPLFVSIGVFYWDFFTSEDVESSCAFGENHLLLENNKKCLPEIKSSFTQDVLDDRLE